MTTDDEDDQSADVDDLSQLVGGAGGICFKHRRARQMTCITSMMTYYLLPTTTYHYLLPTTLLPYCPPTYNDYAHDYDSDDEDDDGDRRRTTSKRLQLGATGWIPASRDGDADDDDDDGADEQVHADASVNVP